MGAGIDAVRSSFQLVVTVLVAFLPFHLRQVSGALYLACSHGQQLGMAWGKHEALDEIQTRHIQATPNDFLPVLPAKPAKVVGRNQDALDLSGGRLGGFQPAPVDPPLDRKSTRLNSSHT